MTKIQDLVKKYECMSDIELLDIFEQVDDYSDEAKQALMLVLNKNGGLNNLKERLKKEHEINEEYERIQNETIELYNQGVKKDDIFKSIHSELISKTELEELLSNTLDAIKEEKADKKIKPRTIIGGLIGGAIGGTIGGILWGFQMIYSGYMFYIFGVGLLLLSYAFVRWFTKQSKRNIAVIVITIISVVYALGLGQLIFEIIGYKGL